MAKSNPAAPLIEALQKLRKALLAECAQFPGPVGWWSSPGTVKDWISAYGIPGRECPQREAVVYANAVVGCLLRKGKIGSDVPNTALASEDQLEDIYQFVRAVDELKRLPARPGILRTLDTFIENLGGQPAPGSQSNGPWSKPDGPSQWAKAFGYSVDTLMRRFKAGTIRHKKETSKSYRIHVHDLPK